jgi:NADH:ubiquinone oxidoreductase subunit 6 (subunit J)
MQKRLAIYIICIAVFAILFEHALYNQLNEMFTEYQIQIKMALICVSIFLLMTISLVVIPKEEFREKNYSS